MLEGKSGAAQNAVREDYPEMAALVDQFSSSASEYESAEEFADRIFGAREKSTLDDSWFRFTNRYAAERQPKRRG